MPVATPIAADTEANAELFRVLGHETRLRLLLLLVDGEVSVGALDSVSGVGQPALSQQLAVLRKAGLVATRRAAKQVYYRVDPAALSPVMALLGQLGKAAQTEAPLRPQLQSPAAPADTQPSTSAAGFARML